MKKEFNEPQIDVIEMDSDILTATADGTTTSVVYVSMKP